MSDVSKTIPELIAEARKAERAVYLATEEAVAKDISRIIKGLADALEAAQGAVPQAPSECDCGAGPGSATCKRWCATRSAPVQPSSAVDEGKLDESGLAAVIYQAIESMPHARRLYPDVYAQEVAKAVIERRAEWLPSSAVDEGERDAISDS